MTGVCFVVLILQLVLFLVLLTQAIMFAPNGGSVVESVDFTDFTAGCFLKITLAIIMIASVLLSF